MKEILRDEYNPNKNVGLDLKKKPKLLLNTKKEIKIHLIFYNTLYIYLLEHTV